MIIGVIGDYCSGKSEFCSYLVEKYNFSLINNSDLDVNKICKFTAFSLGMGRFTKNQRKNY